MHFKSISEFVNEVNAKGNDKSGISFSIFIGYEIDIKGEQQKYSNDEFPIKIEEKIVKQIEDYKNNVYKLIQEYGLIGYTFYVFIMPFTNIDENRKNILKKVLE